MKLKSLKSNILLYFILFSVIPLVIGASVTLYYMYKSKEESLYHKHIQVLKQVTYEVDTIIKTVEDLGLFVKNNYRTRKHNLLTGLTKVQKNITTILILDNNGILQDFDSTISNNIFKGYDYSNIDYFNAIKNGKSSYWTKVYLSQATQLPSISYAIRIDENAIAVLIVDLSRLNNFSKKFKSLDGTSMVRIVDENAIFIAYPDKPEYILQRKSIKGSSIYEKYIRKNYNNKQIIFIGNNNIKHIGVFDTTKNLKWTIIIRETYSYVFDTFDNLIRFIILFIIILTLVSLYFSLKLSKSILKPLDDVNQKMDNIAHGNYTTSINKTNYKELDLLSSNFIIMQDKIIEREEQNRQKDKQIFEASKLVQMGEMIGNIAHQWRQPLSVISTSASGMKLEKEYDLLTDEKLNEYCDSIINNTDYLSRTIDTFRNFIKDKKDKKDIILQNQIDEALNIVSSTLRSHFIELINKIDYKDKIKLTITAGELSQVIINIINNSKDILIEKKIEEPLVIISCYKENDMAIISIEDNGGGIPENILSKVFEPYFTTKHQSQGTGLGLHMSYKIITESLNGKLYVKNTNLGAKFYIELPLNSKV